MTNKYQTILQLAEDTGKEIVRNGENWRSFLRTAGNLYQYPFRDQLLIYAQRPDATGCASIEIWNRHMNCWVNKGAKGIALLDDAAPRPRLKYVFDLSDVHKARRIGRFPYLWEVKPEHEQAVRHRLETVYGVTSEGDSFEDWIKELSE